MVSDGIKAARIQAQHSPLINSTGPGMAFQANVMSAVRHATGWLSPHRGGRARRAGRRAAGPSVRPPRAALTRSQRPGFVRGQPEQTGSRGSFSPRVGTPDRRPH